MRLLLLLACAAVSVAGQPFINYRGVVNAASSMSPGLPAGGIARGSTFSIYGKNLGPGSTPTLAFPLSTTLGGVSITVTQGSSTLNAIPVFVSPGQINAIMPSNASLGMATLRVIFNNGHSNPSPVRIVNSSFGIFSASGAGTGPGILQNFISAGQQPINALSIAAQRGQVMTLWGTGLGPVQQDNVAPTPANLATHTEVFVGGVPVALAYNGRSPCCAGIDQIVFTVPAGAPLGCWVPVYVKTEQAVVSNSVTMAITDGSGTCAEPGNPLAQTLIQGGRGASFLAARFSIREDVAVSPPQDATTDVIGGFIAEQKAGPFNFNPLLSLPPAGTCSAYGIAGNLSVQVPLLPGMLPTGRVLNAGALSVSGPKGTQVINSTTLPGVAAAYLGSGVLSLPQLIKLFLDPGSISLTAVGGADVGPFSAAATMPQGFTWTNRDQLASITRSQGFTVNWSGSASNSVFIAGGSVDVPTNSSAIFVCQATPGATSFTVPPDILANIVPARTRLTQSIGVVYVGEWPLASPVSFQATNLDTGALLTAQVIARTVVFR